MLSKLTHKKNIFEIIPHKLKISLYILIPLFIYLVLWQGEGFYDLVHIDFSNHFWGIFIPV